MLHVSLEADMVISIETTMAHPNRGFIKLENAVAVTEEGCEASAIRGGAGTGRDDDRLGRVCGPTEIPIWPALPMRASGA